MTHSKKAFKSVLIMIIFAMGSKLLGFIREVLIAAKFGSGSETDTFFIALTAVGLLSTMFTHSINTTMIPVMSEIEVKEGKEGKNSHTNNLLNIIILISFIVIILGWILAPLIIRILAHGFTGEQFNLAVLMMRIGLPVLVFAGIVGVFRGYLQSEHMFIESSAAQFPFNLTYIFFLLALSSMFGIKGLMVTSVLAVAAQIVIQVPGIIKTKYRYKFTLDIKDLYIKKILLLALPVIFSVAVNDLNTIVDKSLASTLVDGSISALNYANRLNVLVLGVFITAISTVIFPMLSKEANSESYDELKRLIRHGVNIIVLITVPATVGMIILSGPIVELAFERGAFDSTATHMTSGALIFYSLGLVGMSLRIMVEKVYYALQDTKTPMINGFIAVALNIILNLILIRFMAHRGLALATAISASITTGLLLYGLKKKIGGVGFRELLGSTVKSISASLIMGIIVYLIYYSFDAYVYGNIIFQLALLLISVSVGAIIYLLTIYLLRVEEITWFMNLIKRKVKKEVR